MTDAQRKMQRAQLSARIKAGLPVGYWPEDNGRKVKPLYPGRSRALNPCGIPQSPEADIYLFVLGRGAL